MKGKRIKRPNYLGNHQPGYVDLGIASNSSSWPLHLKAVTLIDTLAILSAETPFQEVTKNAFAWITDQTKLPQRVFCADEIPKSSLTAEQVDALVAAQNWKDLVGR